MSLSASSHADGPIEVFVVDDEPALRGMIEDYLSMQGFSVSGAENGTALDRLLATRQPAVIVLDVNMPGEDGLSIVRRLRNRAQRMGVIMLTANGDETSKVTGLANGADDYIVKPFELRELLARLRSVLRRLPPAQAAAPSRTARLAFGSYSLDPEGRRLFDRDGLEVEISAMEYELLDVFARHPRQVFSRDRLCELAHGRPLGDGDRSVDIRIARLRRKLEGGPARPALLRTVRGEGYVFEP